jgi:hypothetical protein
MKVELLQAGTITKVALLPMIIASEKNMEVT